ncbi:hypothetical protein ACEN88_34890, partial [Massilia sp. CT11-108]|uniref:hypothetical protein n=1 Tax=Massilia sp. CT11-108 TaxID=3393900 RepID=UPI0039A4E10E
APDRPALAGDGAHRHGHGIGAVDAQGRPVPDANLHVTFDLAGPGAIIGVGNGDPNSHESEKAPERNLYNGLAQVIVQSRRAGQVERHVQVGVGDGTALRVDGAHRHGHGI